MHTIPNRVKLYGLFKTFIKKYKNARLTPPNAQCTLIPRCFRYLPRIPGCPLNPGLPEKPLSPFTPGNPGYPWSPELPTSPLTPFGPFRPGKPGCPGGPEKPKRNSLTLEKLSSSCIIFKFKNIIIILKN